MRNKYLNEEAFKKKYGVYSECLIGLAKSYPRTYANIGNTSYMREWCGHYVNEAKIDQRGDLSYFFCFDLANDYNDKRKTFTDEMYHYHYYTNHYFESKNHYFKFKTA
jgi:hypothetical protein